jgi:hypothetical protein
MTVAGKGHELAGKVMIYAALRIRRVECIVLRNRQRRR